MSCQKNGPIQHWSANASDKNLVCPGARLDLVRVFQVVKDGTWPWQRWLPRDSKWWLETYCVYRASRACWRSYWLHSPGRTWSPSHQTCVSGSSWQIWPAPSNLSVRSSCKVQWCLFFCWWLPGARSVALEYWIGFPKFQSLNLQDTLNHDAFDNLIWSYMIGHWTVFIDELEFPASTVWTTSYEPSHQLCKPVGSYDGLRCWEGDRFQTSIPKVGYFPGRHAKFGCNLTNWTRECY